MKKIYLIPALVAAGLLSACSTSSTTPSTPGGNGGGGNGGGGNGAPSQLEGAMAFVETFDDYATVTNVEHLSHTASMSGYLAASDSNEDMNFLGDATADFNFGNATLVGNATNFNRYSDETDGTRELISELGGSMSIIGEIQPNGFTYGAAGQLTGIGNDDESLTANVILVGHGGFYTDGTNLGAYGQGPGVGRLYGPDQTQVDQFGLTHWLVVRE